MFGEPTNGKPRSVQPENNDALLVASGRAVKTLPDYTDDEIAAEHRARQMRNGKPEGVINEPWNL